MKKMIGLMVLALGLLTLPCAAYAGNYSLDILITPSTPTGFFAGVVGGDGNPGGLGIDWGIGNTVPFQSVSDDLVLSTCTGDFMTGSNWKERMRITKEGNVGIGTTEPAFIAKLDIRSNIASPTGVWPNMCSVREGKGDNATFIGVSGGYFQARDRTDVTAANKGVLYGLQVAVVPTVPRNNVPFDDVTGLVVQNDGTAKGTDAVYIGRNSAIAGSEWITAFLVDADADTAFRSNGNYTTALIDLNGKFVVKPDGKVGIGMTEPSVKLEVDGNVLANSFLTGDIIFHKDDKPVWRMYEDEKGLYVQSLTTDKKYTLVLEEMDDAKAGEADNQNLDAEMQAFQGKISALEARLAKLEALLSKAN